MTLKVYNVLGQEVATLVNKQMEPGSHKVEFGGDKLASGVYYYQLQAGGFVGIKKMAVLR